MERLGEVIVGAEVGAVDLVHGGVACSEHHDRHPTAAAPQLLQYPDPVEVGQHHVEDDHIRTGSARRLNSRGAIVDAQDLETAVLQLHRYQLGYVAVVLDDKHARSRSHRLLDALLRYSICEAYPESDTGWTRRGPWLPQGLRSHLPVLLRRTNLQSTVPR